MCNVTTESVKFTTGKTIRENPDQGTVNKNTCPNIRKLKKWPKKIGCQFTRHTRTENTCRKQVQDGGIVRTQVRLSERLVMSRSGRSCTESSQILPTARRLSLILSHQIRKCGAARTYSVEPITSPNHSNTLHSHHRPPAPDGKKISVYFIVPVLRHVLIPN